MQGLRVMITVYEKELEKPIRNLVTGELARSLLIQVQKLKCDTEAAMRSMDQILSANELTVKLIAGAPRLRAAAT